MTKLLKPVQRLLIGIMILLVAVAVSSLAEEITMTTIVAPTALERSYLFISETFGEQLVVVGEVPAAVVLGTYFRYPWTAPKTGEILIKWYNPGVYVDIPNASALGEGHFGLRIFIDGQPSVNNGMSSLRHISFVDRFAGGIVQYPPVTETFAVTEGETYSIDLMYFAQWFKNLRATFARGGGVFTIEYVEFQPHPIVY